MKPNDRYSFYLEGTNGKGVLLIHGLTGAPPEMKLVAKQLHRKGYSIYAPLLAGHGADKQTLTATRWENWLEGIMRDAEIFSRNVDSLYTAGICVGGKLGMMAALRMRGLIKATAIYSPCFRYDGWNVPFYYPILSRNIGWLSHIPLLTSLSFSETDAIGIKDERLRRMMQAMTAEGVIEDFPAQSLIEMHRLGKTLKGALSHMRTPTLVLHASEDDLSSPKNARIIAEQIGAPHELHWIDDSYHMIHMDRQHAHVADLTAQFFERDDVRAAA